MSKNERGLGAIKSPFDNKRLKYAIRSATFEEAEQLPESFSLREYVEADNQGSVGSCTGWGFKKVKHIAERLQNNREIDFSAGYLYWRGREYAVPPIPDWEEGNYPIAVLKLMADKGATTEECAPTDTSAPFSYSECGNADEIAGCFKIDAYHAVPLDPASIKAAMYGITYIQPYKMPDGSPGKCALAFCIPIYDSYYETKSDGVTSSPSPGERLLGYHLVASTGWLKINGEEYWEICGSWTKSFGDEGFNYIRTRDYPINEAWMITEGPPSPGPEPEPEPSEKDTFWEWLWKAILSLFNHFFNGKVMDFEKKDVAGLLLVVGGIILLIGGKITYEQAYALIGLGLAIMGIPVAVKTIQKRLIGKS